MRKRRMITLLNLVLCLALLAVMPACTVERLPQTGTTTAQQTSLDGSTPRPEDGTSGLLFWEVTAPQDGGTLYLLGSIHTADETIYPMPDAVTEAFLSADVLAVEADIVSLETDLAEMTELSKLMIYDDGSTIRDHIPQDVYEAAKALLTENEMYNFAYDYMKPAMWSSMLDLMTSDAAGLTEDYGVDRYFLSLAHERGMRVHELESARMQYEMLTGFSDDLSTLLLKTALEDREAQVQELLTLYEIWKSGDFEAFSLYMLEEPEGLTEEEQRLYEEYTVAMMDARNVGMAEQAAELLESGETCFYIVGAGHMVGDTGLVAALGRAGYTVEQR